MKKNLHRKGLYINLIEHSIIYTSIHSNQMYDVFFIMINLSSTITHIIISIRLQQ